MKRKVIRQGHNTLTVTLPRKWCSNQNIHGGDEIEVSEKGRALVINGRGQEEEQNISVNVSSLDRTTIQMLVQSVYRFGYDRIEITCKDLVVPHHRLGKNVTLSGVIYGVANRLVGAEVISATQKRFVIKRIANESIADFPTVLRRVFLLLLEMMESFIIGLEHKEMSILNTIEHQHVNIKKFVNFLLRLLTKFGYDDPRKTCFYFHIVSLLSKSEDIIKNQARFVLKHWRDLSSELCIQLLRDIQNSLHLYYETFYDYKLQKVGTLDALREKLRENLFHHKPQMSRCEVLITGSIGQIVELVHDMTETRMALEY